MKVTDYTEYLSMGNYTNIQPIFNMLESERLPMNGKVSLNPKTRVFGDTSGAVKKINPADTGSHLPENQ